MELFSPGHLIPLLIVVAVLFFGWKQMPDMARSLGRSLRVFKTEIKGLTEDDKARDEHERRVDEPKAIEAPVARAEVKKVVPVNETAAAATRPRPAPRPVNTTNTGGQ